MPNAIAAAAGPSPLVGAPAAPKSGFLTSEFALTVVSLLVAALVGSNIVPAADQAEVEGMFDAIVAALASKNVVAIVLAVFPVVTYIRSRGLLKQLMLHLHAQQVAPAPVAIEPVVVVVAPASAPVADAFKV